MTPIYNVYTGLPVIQSNEEESVLLGSAILAAKASGKFSSVQVNVTQQPNISIF